MRDRGGTDSSREDSREDELLSGLYQQVAETQEPQFAAGYDLQAGLDRYRGWLGEHSQAAARPERPEWSADLAVIELYTTQYKALVLRYYADLSEAEIAATMGISRGAVKSHTAPRLIRIAPAICASDRSP